MELKILGPAEDSSDNESRTQQRCCESPKKTYALVWKVEPSPDGQDQPSVEEGDDDQKNDQNANLKTPTSTTHKIQQLVTCPPAPRKPKSAPLRKRKGSHRLLDLSSDVLSLYPPALLADFNKKLKKVR